MKYRGWATEVTQHKLTELAYLSHSLCLCVLLYKHSCSCLSCHSCRGHGFHKVAVHTGSPLGGDKDKHFVLHGSCHNWVQVVRISFYHQSNKLKVTYTSGTGPQRIPLCTHTNNSVCNPDTCLHSDRGWTHSCPDLHTYSYSRFWILSCIHFRSNVTC